MIYPITLLILLAVVSVPVTHACFRRAKDFVENVENAVVNEYHTIENENVEEFNVLKNKTIEGFIFIKNKTVQEYNNIEKETVKEFNILKDETIKEFNKIQNKTIEEYNFIKGETVKDIEIVEKVAVKEFKIIENKTIEIWKNITRKIRSQCSCIDYDCGCCIPIILPEIGLNETFCVNITYLVHDYGVSFTITANGYTLFNESASLRNPPPICVGIIDLKEFAQFCIALYDLDVSSTRLHGCMKFEVKSVHIIRFAEYEVGCLTFEPPKPATTVSPPILQSIGNAISSRVTIIVGIVAGLFMLSCVLILIVWKRRQDPIFHALNFGRPKKTYGSTETLTHEHSVNC